MSGLKKYVEVCWVNFMSPKSYKIIHLQSCSFGDFDHCIKDTITIKLTICCIIVLLQLPLNIKS